ncbi:hypothetical protein BKA63DRAFT_605055 [Paraphoma chrysanthemicola]|nr:hypothetical protein BKA63DRAFT_605055 [Paraphoma chrysanthemicola]
MSAPSGPNNNAAATVMHVQAAPIGPTQQDAQFTASRAKKASKPEIDYVLIGDIEITFDGPEERVRANAGILAPSVFRMSFEDSATLNYHQPKECLKKSRDAPSAKLDEQNGFQPLLLFNASKHLNPKIIKSTFNPQRRQPLSPFVATYQEIEDAIHRCHRQYTELRLVGQRPTVTEIDTSTLLAATLHGTMQTCKVYYKGKTLVRIDSSLKTHRVKYPVCIRDTARPADGSPISIQEFYDSGADMWIRGLELRKTGPFDMNYGAADTHDNDWLCCGPIPRTYIKDVLPFDGEKLHYKKTSEVVKSKESIEIYIFNWNLRKWEHNPDMTDYRPYRLERPGDRRGPPSDNDDDDDDDDDDDEDGDRCEPPRKRAQVLHV